jgi:hypothetical protein
MRRIIFTFAGILTLAFFAVVIGGCSNSAAPTASQKKSADTSQSSTTIATDDPKITAAFAELSTEDRALAVKQKICPVSGEKLGTMGAPKKVDVKGRAFICCDGCREQLLAQPDEYLAKIDK